MCFSNYFNFFFVNKWEILIIYVFVPKIHHLKIMFYKYFLLIKLEKKINKSNR